MANDRFTHKGWFGICPVYLADFQTYSPLVEPRHWVLYPFFWFSLSAFGFHMMFMELLKPGYEPGWPLVITGKLPEKGGQ